MSHLFRIIGKFCLTLTTLGRALGNGTCWWLWLTQPAMGFLDAFTDQHFAIQWFLSIFYLIPSEVRWNCNLSFFSKMVKISPMRNTHSFTFCVLGFWCLKTAVSKIRFCIHGMTNEINNWYDHAGCKKLFSPIAVFENYQTHHAWTFLFMIMVYVHRHI